MNETPDHTDEPLEWWRRDQPISWRDLFDALAQLTALGLTGKYENRIGRSALFYPLVGLAIGALWWSADSFLFGSLQANARAAVAVMVIALLGRGRGWLGIYRSPEPADSAEPAPPRTRGRLGNFLGTIAVLLVCALQWWALVSLRKARTPALVFAPMLSAWGAVVLAHGSRAARRDGRRVKYAQEVGFREFAAASVFSFGILFTLGQVSGILIGVAVAVLLVAIRTSLHATIKGVTDATVWAASEIVLTVVLTLFALLEHGR